MKEQKTRDRGQKTEAGALDNGLRIRAFAFVLCLLSLGLPPATARAEATTLTLKVGETTDLVERQYMKNSTAQDRWWKLDGGDATVASVAFENANPSEPRMSGSHSTTAAFRFTGVKEGATKWTLYSYTDQDETLNNTYPGFEKARAGDSQHDWSSGSGHTFTITVTGGGEVDPPAPTAAKFCITPYLQRPATDAMTVIFFTDSACTATTTCTLKNGGGETKTETTTGVWAQALTNNVFNNESSVWNNNLYRHRVRFEGLDANRIYDYTVTLDGGATYSNTFRTAPDRNTPIRFVSYADCETEKNPRDNFVANLKRMKERQPDFFALSGDYAARGGRQEHWDGFWQANAGAKADVAGSIPILSAVGNHDLFDQGSHTGGYYYDMQGEPSTERYMSYFEVDPNGVDFAHAPAPHTETRDLSQLFHRKDYGPVTLIFLDTNNGQDGDTDADHDKDTNYLDRDDGQHLKGGLDRRKGCRHPDFNVGSPQYEWLVANLKDAQEKSRFTFVFNHHCPYSRGAHNKDWRDNEDGSAKALRFLTETFVRYGVDGWYCGHDELLEHSITNGWEILPNGQRRKHTLSIYDLGCSGDTPRSSNVCTNPLEYWWSSNNYGGSGSYGFLETDVTTNKQGRWTCTITPIQGSTGSPLAARIVYVENPNRGEDENDLVYAQATGSGSLRIDGASQTLPPGWLAWEKPPEGPGGGGNPPVDPEDPESEPEVVTNLTMSVGETLVFTNRYRKNLRYWLLGGEGEIATAELNVPVSPCADYVGYSSRSTVKTNEVTLTITATAAGEKTIHLGRQYKYKPPRCAVTYKITVR